MPPVPVINSEKFRCEDGSEISRLRVRDGVRNCFGGSDELPPSSQPVLNNNNIIEKEKEETKARAAFRRSARFTAAPMPDYDALASLGVAAVAERALTRPESPPLRTNRRASRWG